MASSVSSVVTDGDEETQDIALIPVHVPAPQADARVESQIKAGIESFLLSLPLGEVCCV